MIFTLLAKTTKKVTIVAMKITLNNICHSRIELDFGPDSDLEHKIQYFKVKKYNCFHNSNCKNSNDFLQEKNRFFETNSKQ